MTGAGTAKRTTRPVGTRGNRGLPSFARDARRVTQLLRTVGELTAVTPSGTGNVPAVTYAYDPSGRESTLTR